MLTEEFDMDVALRIAEEEGIEKGREIGKKIGIEIGKKIGIEEGKFVAVFELVKDELISIEIAIQIFGFIRRKI